MKPLRSEDLCEQPAIYDRDEALHQVGGNPRIADELRQMMISDLPAQSAQLSVAIRSEDYEEVRRLAHRVSGSASCCGTPAVHEACAAVQASIREQALADTPLLIEVLQEQISLLLEHTGEGGHNVPNPSA